MDTQLHMYLGYAIFLFAVSNMALSLSVARSDASMARVMHWTHSVGLIWLGRLEILLGIGVVMRFKDVWLSPAMDYAWQGWLAIALWGPVEVMAKRMVTPDLAVVQDGGQASSKLATGAGVQLLLITVIFGLMHSIK